MAVDFLEQGKMRFRVEMSVCDHIDIHRLVEDRLKIDPEYIEEWRLSLSREPGRLNKWREIRQKMEEKIRSENEVLCLVSYTYEEGSLCLDCLRRVVREMEEMST